MTIHTRDWPEFAEIRPRAAVDGVVRPPGSKSITNRALIVAALAHQPSTIRFPLMSDDILAMRDSLAALGIPVRDIGDDLRVETTGSLTPTGDTANARGSGTTARFMTAAATLATGPVLIDGHQRMRERPIQDLVDALRQLGAEIDVLGTNGCPPVRVRGRGLDGGHATIDASRSSQFVSAVMMVAPRARRSVTLDLKGPVVSRPYLVTTMEVMGAFGIPVDMDADRIHIPAGRYHGRDYDVEADASAAVYPWCAAAIAGGSVTVRGIDVDSTQADMGVLGVLESMGCGVSRAIGGITVSRESGPLTGVDVDMNSCPDGALAVAVVAAFAEGPTTIRNVANLRIKETDRLAALDNELSKIGASTSVGEDWITIRPGPLRPATISTYDDHRIAMAFALAGLRVDGMLIHDPGCVEKTWPDYFSMLEQL